MVLKESFEYVSIIKRLFHDAQMQLIRSENIHKVTETSLFSKADANLEDVVTDMTNYKYRPDGLIEVQKSLTEDMIRLQKAISEAKRCCDIDLDAEMTANKARRDMISSLRVLLNTEDSESDRYDTAYRFNQDGTQVAYNYKVHTEKTVDVDRKKMQEMMTALMKEADEVSTKIDKALVTTEVDFKPWIELKGLSIRDVYDAI